MTKSKTYRALSRFLMCSLIISILAPVGDFVLPAKEAKAAKIDFIRMIPDKLYLSQPNNLVFDSGGNMYVADSGNNQIQKFDSDGNFVSKWGEYGTDDGQFNYPTSLAIDSIGYIYVVDRDNHRIQKFDSDGNFVAKHGTEGGGTTSHFDEPTDIAINSNDLIYVVDKNNNRIRKLTSNGSSFAYANCFGGNCYGTDSFLNPEGIFVDENDNIYIADTGNNRVQIFDPSNTFVSSFGIYGTGDGQFNSPRDVVVDGEGNIYVLDSNSHRIQKFDSGFNFLSWFGGQGYENGDLRSPQGLALDSTDNLYVSDTDNNRITKFNSGDTYVTSWSGPSAENGQFSSAQDVVVDSIGNIYVVDTFNHRIQKFDADGNFIIQWGGSGSADGQFNFPSGIVIDNSGNIIVVDSLNSRIQKFNSGGVFLSKWGVSGVAPGEFSSVNDIAIDSGGNIYTTETATHRVQKFDSTGLLITSWGSYGSTDIQFSTPRAIAIDSSDNVYVADTGNRKIKKFDSNGSLIATIGSYGTGDGQFNSPYGLAVDSSNNIYVSDMNGHRIQKFSSDGTYLAKWGSSVANDSGSEDVNFDSPQDLFVDANDNIYVADTDNHRIQILYNADFDEPMMSSSFSYSTENRTLSVSSVGDAFNYYIENITTGNNSGWIESSSYTFGNIQCGDTYSFKVKVKNTLGDISAWSDTVSLTPLCEIEDASNSSPFEASTDFQFLKGNALDLAVVDSKDGIITMNPAIYSLEYFFNSGASFTDTPYDFNINTEAVDGIYNKTIKHPASISWNNKASIPTPRTAAASAVVDGKMYIVGGTDVSWDKVSVLEVYDTETDTWDTSKASMSSPENGAVMAAIDNKIYVIGGAGGEVYDIGTDTWSPIANMGVSRNGPVGGLNNGEIYVTGGMNSGSGQRSLEIYNPETDTWRTGTSFPESVLVAGSSGTFYNGKLYIAGGHTDGDTPFSSSLTAYDPGTDTWDTSLANMPMNLSAGKLITAGEKLLHIGGVLDTDWDPINYIFVYDPNDDSWNAAYDIPRRLHRPSAEVIGDKLHIIGGRDENYDMPANNYSLDVDNFFDKSKFLHSFQEFTWDGSDSTVSYSLDGGESYINLGTTSGTYQLNASTAFGLNIKMTTPGSMDSFSASYKYLGDTGTYISQVFDAGERVNWGQITLTADMSDAITVYTRSGDSSNFSTTWSDWQLAENGIIESVNNRYLQVKFVLAYSGIDTPAISDYKLFYVDDGKDLLIPGLEKNISSSTPEIVVFTENMSTDSVINISEDINNPKLNLGGMVTPNGSNAAVTISKAIKVNTATDSGHVKVEIPDNTTITVSNSNWAGLFNLPQIKNTSGLSLGANKSATYAFTIGDSDTDITLDKAVKLTFSDRAGEKIGYINSQMEFNIIGDTCSFNTQEAGNNLPESGDCKIDEGDDLVVWTKHFTDFVIYEESDGGNENGNDNENNEGSPSSTAPVPNCTSVTYTDWKPCQAGFNLQFREVSASLPMNCSLTPAQREAMERVCAITTGQEQSSENNNSSLREEVLQREKSAFVAKSQELVNRLKGRILLQVENKGEAWYINPDNLKKYYLGRPLDAFNIMRTLGLGISNVNLSNFQSKGVPQSFAGKIFLQVEEKGEAYYVNPLDLSLNYLGRPLDAFNLMRTLGLGITNDNLREIEVED